VELLTLCTAQYKQACFRLRIAEHVDDPVNTKLSKGKHRFARIHGFTMAGLSRSFFSEQKQQKDLEKN
jgi:hypothetical protein